MWGQGYWRGIAQGFGSDARVVSSKRVGMSWHSPSKWALPACWTEPGGPDSHHQSGVLLSKLKLVKGTGLAVGIFITGRGSPWPCWALFWPVFQHFFFFLHEQNGSMIKSLYICPRMLTLGHWLLRRRLTCALVCQWDVGLKLDSVLPLMLEKPRGILRADHTDGRK